MRPSIRIGKIAGVEVGVHYTAFVTLAMVAWSLANGVLPNEFPGWSNGTYWATGLLAGLLLFASVLVHELAHSVVARFRGIPPEGITLFLLGGVSNLKSESGKARDEFVISAVGPLTSLVLAFAFGLILLGLRDDSARGVSGVWFLTRLDVTNAPVAAVVWYLALINLLLAGFNLLPAFPLDGGRVFRSVVWGVTGSLSKATTVAARGGQVVGLGMIGVGALQMFQGNILGGLWFGLIGWFLHGAATSSRHETVSRELARGVRVRDVMDRYPVTIGPDVSIADALHEYFVRGSARSLPVCEGDRLVGIISLTDIKGVPQGRWGVVTVKDNMTPMPLRLVKPDDDLSHALTLLGAHSIHQLPVLEGDRLVGLLTRAHVIRHLHSQGELGSR